MLLRNSDDISVNSWSPSLQDSVGMIGFRRWEFLEHVEMDRTQNVEGSAAVGGVTYGLGEASKNVGFSRLFFVKSLPMCCFRGLRCFTSLIQTLVVTTSRIESIIGMFLGQKVDFQVTEITEKWKHPFRMNDLNFKHLQFTWCAREHPGVVSVLGQRSGSGENRRNLGVSTFDTPDRTRESPRIPKALPILSKFWNFWKFEHFCLLYRA